MNARRPVVDTAIILAGGQSSRMGMDKAEIRWRGETLLQRICRGCHEAGLRRTVVVGRNTPPVWDVLGSVFLSDEMPQAGPLAGVLTGLIYLESASSTQYALALPCDMPFLDMPGLSWLIEQADRCARYLVPGFAAVTPDGRIQPLIAAYSTALIPVIRERLNSDKRSLLGLVESEHLLQAQLPPALAMSFASANTPEELALLQKQDRG